jgi:hypothetical protein
MNEFMCILYHIPISMYVVCLRVYMNVLVCFLGEVCFLWVILFYFIRGIRFGKVCMRFEWNMTMKRGLFFMVFI